MPLPDDPLNPGIQYNALDGALTTPAGCTFLELGFQFSVATLDGSARIKDNSLELTGYDFSDEELGRIQIVEDISDDPATLGQGKGVSKSVEVDHKFGISDLFDEIFFDPVSKLYVETGLLILTDGADYASVTSFEQHFSQIPAAPLPERASTVLLLGLAMLGLERLRRRAGW